jgi:hypothetical protein
LRTQAHRIAAVHSVPLRSRALRRPGRDLRYP